MPNFISDTRVELDPVDPQRVRANLSPNWAVWGPNGGYLAAIALRAAMARSRCTRPASFQCHFLAVGAFEGVDIRVSSLGGGKRAESLRVDVMQKERTLLVATVWLVDDGLDGYRHDVGQAPDVAPPSELRSYNELADDYDEWFPIWRSMEGRPLRWDEGPGAPISQTWLRFNETPIENREADAVRQLFWLDFPGWNATIAAHQWPLPYIAPNLDLTVQFHRFVPDADWMLADGYVPLAADGLVGCVSRLWSEDWQLLATGTSKHLCRPNPRYQEELAMAREQGLRPDES
jgi:acyl-CoA thioesterase